MKKKSVIELFCKRRMRGASEKQDLAFVPSPKPNLTKGQQVALEVIGAAQSSASGQVVLLDGVTGSGKTEVYLQAIEKALEQDLGAIVLVPENSSNSSNSRSFQRAFLEIWSLSCIHA